MTSTRETYDNALDNQILVLGWYQHTDQDISVRVYIKEYIGKEISVVKPDVTWHLRPRTAACQHTVHPTTMWRTQTILAHLWAGSLP